MKNKNLNDKAFPAGLFILALAMLFNPNINILDLLPDFIGYLIIARLLVHAARRVPFFEEARLGFLKLSLLSFAKYPAFVFMIMVRSKSNTSDNDIIALFSLVFAIAEVLLSLGAVGNLFSGLSYLGERTGARSVIGEKPSSDMLKNFSLFLVIFKCALYSLPEFLILTTSVDAGSPATVGPLARFYTVAVLFGQVVGYAVGAAWLAFFSRYLLNIKRSGEFYPAVMQLSDDAREAEISRKIKKDNILKGLKLLPAAALISFDITPSKFSNVNVLPHFIIGFFLLFIIQKLKVKNDRLYAITLASGFVYSCFSVFSWFFSIYYNDNFSYVDTVLYNEANSAFGAYIAISIVEAVLFCVFLTFFSLMLCRFIRTHTGKTPEGIKDPLSVNENPLQYTVYDRKYHRSLFAKVWIFSSFGFIGAIAKALHVFVENYKLVFSDFSVPTPILSGSFKSSSIDLSRAYESPIIPAFAPWLGTAIVLLSIAWSIYSFYFTGILADDFKMKYSETKVNTEERESQYF